MTAWRTPASAASRKKASKNRVRTAMPSLSRCGVKAGSSSDTSTSPFIMRMKASTPTALTSGSANGSSINGFGPLDAIARRAATAVAVAPTLDARSQLSPSNRLVSVFPVASVMAGLLSKVRGNADDVAQLTQRVVVGEDAAVLVEQFAPRPGVHLPAA